MPTGLRPAVPPSRVHREPPDPNPPSLRARLEVVPPEPARIRGLELAPQRLRIVVVDQDEGFSGGQPRVDTEDARMPATVRDLANVDHLRGVQRITGKES